MTEAEAFKRWCPFARVASTGGACNRAQNSQVDESQLARCIGSACMVWRWDIGDQGGRNGFCGLAGGKGAP